MDGPAALGAGPSIDLPSCFDESADVTCGRDVYRGGGTGVAAFLCNLGVATLVCNIGVGALVCNTGVGVLVCNTGVAAVVCNIGVAAFVCNIGMVAAFATGSFDIAGGRC